MNNNPSMTHLIFIEEWWTKKSSPDDIRSSFNMELLRKVVEAKLKSIK